MAGPLDINQFLMMRGKKPLLDLRGTSTNPLIDMAPRDVAEDAVGVAPVTVNAQVEQAAAAVPEDQSSMWDTANRAISSFQPTAEEVALKKRSEELFRQKQEEQQGSVRDLESTLKNYLAGSGQTNLKPLLGLVDSWTGSKTAQNYAEPESEDKKQEKALHIQDLIAKRKGDITQSELDFIKSRLSDNNSVRLAEIMARQSGREAGLGRKADENVDKFLSKLDTDSAEDAKKFNSMDAAFASGSYGQVMPMLSIFARAVSGEKGVLTDTDIARVMPKNYQGGVAKFLTYFNEVPTSELPKNFTSTLRELLDKARTETAKKYRETLDAKESRLSKLPTFREYAPQYKATFGDSRKSIVSRFGAAPGSGGEWETKTDKNGKKWLVNHSTKEVKSAE